MKSNRYGAIGSKARDCIIEWAFPDKIAMPKTRHYEKQKEYRIAFGVNNALAFQNTTMRLVTAGHIDPRIVANHKEMLIRIGDLRRYCTVWQFRPDERKPSKSLF